jgi:hypothetical protein
MSRSAYHGPPMILGNALDNNCGERGQAWVRVSGYKPPVTS